MVKWEYRTLILVGNEIDLINEFGKDGWELVSIVPSSDDWEPPMAYFKRQVKNTEGPFIKREIIIGKKEKWESDIYTPAGKEVLFKQENKKKKELLSLFRSMVLELIEAGNMIPSDVKKKAYDLIDSCYDEDGELIA